MCDKCDELDKKIARYLALSRQLADPITNEQTNKLIEDLKAEKVALHPEQNE